MDLFSTATEILLSSGLIVDYLHTMPGTARVKARGWWKVMAFPVNYTDEDVPTRVFCSSIVQLKTQVPSWRRIHMDAMDMFMKSQSPSRSPSMFDSVIPDVSPQL